MYLNFLFFSAFSQALERGTRQAGEKEQEWGQGRGQGWVRGWWKWLGMRGDRSGWVGGAGSGEREKLVAITCHTGPGEDYQIDVQRTDGKEARHAKTRVRPSQR